MATLGGKPMAEWIEQYGRSHQHPVNQACHTIGIPMIAISLVLGVVAAVPLVAPGGPIAAGFWKVPVALFVVGWVFQFIGHAVEKEPPEFFKDWRFLLVGLRWWFRKVGL